MIKRILVEEHEGRITSIKSSKVLSNGTCELIVEIADEKVEATKNSRYGDENFILIEASKLSLEDEFMQHIPQTENEKEFKKLLEQAIKEGIKDFWRPRIDPSFTKDKSDICYVLGNQPAIGKSYNWWKKTAREYNPRCGSRLGTKAEYVAFLGVLIKTLVSEGWTIVNAWHVVCDDSKYIGHYCNSENAKRYFEPTGSRELYGFFDLANTCKILEEAGDFWLASGYYMYGSFFIPLANLYHSNIQHNCINYSVGWLVLEKGSADY